MNAAMKWLERLLGLLALAAVITQFITGHAYVAAPDEATYLLRFFSYFTILSNLAAVLVLLGPDIISAQRTQWLRSACVRGSVVVYLTVTSLVYFTMLRHLWHPVGFTFYADCALHYVVPVLYWLCWLLRANAAPLHYRHVSHWLVFPLLYFTYTLAHGALSGFYPYPFLNAAQLGYEVVLFNGAVLLLLFLGLGLFVVRLTQRGAEKNSPGKP